MRIFGFEFKKLKTAIKRQFSHYMGALSPESVYYKQTAKMLQSLDLDSASLRLLKIARNLAISNPSIYGYLQTMESEIYGEKGFILDLDTQNEDFNLKIEGFWKEWEKECDLKGEFDFKDFERFVLMHYLRDGECFVHMSSQADGLKLQVIPPEHIDYNYNDGVKIKKGIEFNQVNQVIAYHINIDDMDRSKKIRVSAEDMIHLKRTFSTQQIRGISHLTPVIFKVMQSDKYIESVITQANIASKLSLIATPKEETEGYSGNFMGDLEENKPVEPKTIEIEDGRIIAMNEDYKIEPLNINHNPNIEAFMLDINLKIAKALGISYMTFTGNLRNANFSSSRLGVEGERRNFKRIQKLLIRKIHSPIYEAFIQNLALRGKITPKEAKNALSQYSFKTQGYPYVDPAKEITALKMEVELGLKSIKQIWSDKGIEPLAQVRDIKEVNDILLTELSRLRSVLSPHPTPANNQEDDEDEEDNPKGDEND
ncbi:phage portal protein [Helicobacter sp. 13S00477-4]|uniref:phage portal protein n=1 Tax=Helicobacter sp. 13S00477-4 TaxID=1905759 RepID=UPI000BA67B54|nr:phage portal protein [Helicobacter sp. 13S00477-4]PAF50843.1 phage portal protein [Helicobacter sp. 13S00477-4]